MSALTKDRLIFDPADLTESDSMGAYMRAGSDGDLISSTNVSGKEGVDSYIINSSLTVTGTDLDIRDLSHSQDSVKVGDGTDFLAVNADGSINAVVTATDLDIRNLSHTQDSIKVGDGTDFMAVNADGSINSVVTATNLDIRDLAFATDSVTAHQGGSWTVTATATDFDIRDLSHTQDSIKIGDGTDFLAVNADGSLNVNLTDDGIADDAADSGNPFKVGGRASDQAVAWDAADAGDRVNLTTDLYRRVLINDSPNLAIDSAAVTVTTTATLLDTSALAGRMKIMIQNLGSNDIFIGPSGVSASSGLRIAKGSTLTLELGQAVSLYGITASGSSNDVRVTQLA